MVSLKEGGGGVFDVSVDGTTVFSKKREGRYPTEGEILGAVLRARGSSG